MLGSLMQVGGKEEEEHSRVNGVCLRGSLLLGLFLKLFFLRGEEMWCCYGASLKSRTANGAALCKQNTSVL